MARRKREKESRATTLKKQQDTANRRAERGGVHNVTDEAREAAVQALLLNPELGVPEIRRRYKLTVSQSLMYKYRKALREGREPWVQSSRGGRPRADRRSASARSVSEAGKISEALATVGAPPIQPPVDGPEPEPTKRGYARKRSGSPEGSALAGTAYDDTADGNQTPTPGADPGVRPPELAKKLATARRSALERVNLLAAEVAMRALTGLKDDLDAGLVTKPKDKAVIAALTSDRFLATSASLEELNPGTSGVAGALEEVKGNREKYQQERRRFEEQLKKKLKIVKIKDYQRTDGWRMEGDDDVQAEDGLKDSSAGD